MTTNPVIDSVEPNWSDCINAIKDAVKDAQPGARDFYLFHTQAQCSQQVCLELGISAKYLKFEGSLNIGATHKKYSNTVVAYIREKAFSASVGITDLDDFFNEDFTNKYLATLKKRKKVGEKNPPLYVSSVMYGRILFFAVSAEETATKISAAISASYGGWAGVDAKLKAEYQDLLKDAKTPALGVGCPGNIGDLLQGAAGLKHYLDKLNNSPDQYSIVGCQLKTFEDKIAKQSETAKYNQTVWSKNSATIEVLHSKGETEIEGSLSLNGPNSQTGKWQPDRTLNPTAKTQFDRGQHDYQGPVTKGTFTGRVKHAAGWTDYNGNLAKLVTFYHTLGEHWAKMTIHNNADTIQHESLGVWVKTTMN
ncbi:thiol-activated cytolysin family protein [Streptomyces albus subsp. chlorinus]|uniref:thiol-activated cytolysin family protein n=1 Tax=Streptomyces albus TaxID=1888 RepID=UPI00156F2524|nr:thiol-activated cytolysin family protein [Streptomyces albus]